MWYPVSDFTFDDAELSISEGDQLTLRVESYSTTEGVAIIENHTTGKGIHKIVTSPAGAPQLLGHHAEWFVAQPVGQLLTNFGVVKFTDAVAYTSDGKNFGPDKGTFLASIVDDGKTLTDTVVNGRELTITYTPKTQPHARESYRASFPGLLTRSTKVSHYPDPFSGAKRYAPDGKKIKSVAGTFTIPGLAAGSELSPEGYTTAIWVGIEGDHLLQVGVVMALNATTGAVKISPTADFLDDVVFYWDDGELVNSVGDVLSLRAEFLSPASGALYIENETTKQSISKNVTLKSTTDPGSFGRQADWVVEAVQYEPTGTMPNFGEVKFTGCKVTLDDGTVIEGIKSASEIFMRTEDHIAIADVDLHDDQVMITYNPHRNDTDPDVPHTHTTVTNTERGTVTTTDVSTAYLASTTTVQVSVTAGHRSFETPHDETWRADDDEVNVNAVSLAAAHPAYLLTPRNSKDQHSRANITGPSWSGAVVNLPNPGPEPFFTDAFGKFNVPHARTASIAGLHQFDGHDQGVAIWVGISGGGGGLLQAGVSFYFHHDTGNVQLIAWTELFPQGSVNVDDHDLTVKPDDIISVCIHRNNLTTGTVIIENETRGQKFQKTIFATQEKENVVGGSAEWIIENFLWPNNTVADFGKVHFTDCHALLSNGSFIGVASSANHLFSYDKEGPPLLLSDVDITSDHDLTVQFDPRVADKDSMHSGLTVTVAGPTTTITGYATQTQHARSILEPNMDSPAEQSSFPAVFTAPGHSHGVSVATSHDGQSPYTTTSSYGPYTTSGNEPFTTVTNGADIEKSLETEMTWFPAVYTAPGHSHGVSVATTHDGQPLYTTESSYGPYTTSGNEPFVTITN